MIERKWKGFNLQEADWNWYETTFNEAFGPNADRYFYRIDNVEYYYDSAAFQNILSQHMTFIALIS